MSSVRLKLGNGAPRRPLREEFMYASGDMAVKTGALDGVQLEHAQCHEAASSQRSSEKNLTRAAYQ